jgi:hypothetical protein
MHIHLDNPHLKPDNPTDSRLKHRAHTEFQLINNKLYRKPDSKFLNPRYTIPESEAFDAIASEHLQLLHAGYMKTWAIVQQKFYGIKREDVESILKRCKNCAIGQLQQKIHWSQLLQKEHGREYRSTMLILDTSRQVNLKGYYTLKITSQNILSYIH